MDKFKVLDLFSGIGGFSLGLERTGGFKTVAFCEIEEFPRKVLNKHWPGVPIYEDVRELTAERLLSDGIRPDVITGGFPCQDISVAGKQGGITADRSGLWTELARLISEVRPKYAIVENVTALLSGERGRWFQRILGGLAEIGYDCEWHCIPASELGANHHRDRVWIIAYSNIITSREKRTFIEANNEWNTTNDFGQVCGNTADVADTISSRQPRPRLSFNASRKKKGGERQASDAEHLCFGGQWPAEPDVGRVANGIPRRIHRLKGLGNAVVPQLPQLLGLAIMEYEREKMQKMPE